MISGRRTEEVRTILGVEGVTYAGLYGLDEREPGAPSSDPAVERAAAGVPNAWVEPKGSALSVHYRQSPDPEEARRMLLERLAPIAAATGRRLIEGKLTVELVPHGVALKGGAVRRLIRDRGLRAALYAGDDLADLEAFEVLGELAMEEVEGVRVAVRGAETPQPLLDAADVIVDGPEKLIELLHELVP